MTRGQRTAHLMVWLALAPLLLMLIVFALINRVEASGVRAGTVPSAEER